MGEIITFLQDGYNWFIGLLPSGLIGNIIQWVTSVVALIVFLIPSIIAVKNRHRQVFWIILLNILLGWTLIGWIIALIWALNSRRR
ncbi:MAG: superinfection immunity protein [Clostridiales bacterium]|jgi:hypothetical protein|nr:superinfection immunity protein [Clostridiales bacterium]